MKLAAWRKREKRTQEWLAAELECSQPFISKIERTINPVIPNVDLMERIFLLTGGEVQPNDFYDIPRWRRALDAAVRALLGKAA